MIIGYYEQSFFGGGTYYKLSKKDNESKYKIEYAHSAVPNYIPEAEKYIKMYENLQIKYDKFCEEFADKIKIEYIDSNRKIKKIIDYIAKCNWKEISKKDYTDNVIDDGANWELYVEINNKKYYIKGYEDYPKEIKKITRELDRIYKIYLERIKANSKDKEIINKNRKKK